MFQVMIRAATKPLQATADCVAKHLICMLKIPLEAVSFFFFFFNSLSLHSSWCFTLKPSVSRQKQCRCRVSRCSADGYFEPRCVEVCSSVTTFFTSCRAPHKDLRDQELITGRQWEMCMIGYEVGSLLCTCSSRQHQLKLPDSLAARSFKSFCLL